MVAHAHAIPLELVGSLLEMVDLTWTAIDHRREAKKDALEDAEDDEFARLRAENHRLRSVLADNLELLYAVYKSPAVAQDCPPDVQERLVAAVGSPSFLKKLESLHQESKVCGTDKGDDLKDLEVVISIDSGEPSLWVLVTHDVDLGCMEEVSQIDNENYVIVDEENVVDGVSDFIARCILEDPKSKNLTPHELQKAVKKTLGTIKDKRKWKDIWEAAKLIYTLATWGIALAGLYRHRAILKVAAKGIQSSANVVMKVL